MPAVVRVKRRIDEEPLSTLVLGQKRRRVSESENEAGTSESLQKPEFLTTLRLAGTITEQEHSAVVNQYVKLTKLDAKEIVQQKARRQVENNTEKNRYEMKRNMHEQRFQVVNCLRTTLEVDNNDKEQTKNEAQGDEATEANAKTNGMGKQLTIIDIEKQQNPEQSQPSNLSFDVEDASDAAIGNGHQQTNGEQSSSTANRDMEYVYDLYHLENDDIDDNDNYFDEFYFSVPSDEGMIFGIDAEEERNMDNESIDSNDENYYANDYPDFDDDSEMERYNDDDDDEDYENDDIERICRNAYRREMVRRQVEMLTNAVANFILSDDDDEDDNDH